MIENVCEYKVDNIAEKIVFDITVRREEGYLVKYLICGPKTANIIFEYVRYVVGPDFKTGFNTLDYNKKVYELFGLKIHVYPWIEGMFMIPEVFKE